MANTAANMKIYEQARTVPQEAQKAIQAGRLKGMTDVNPMYRIKRLTEIFGPCGVGWWYVITDKRIVDDEITGQRAAFVDIDLFYRDPYSGEASMAIPGTGGAAFVTKERSGPYMSDECFKMAMTDAISVAAKALGVAADVYWQKDRTKYSGGESAAAGTSAGTIKTGVGVDFKKDKRAGSHEAAQAAGQAKPEDLNAQAATPPTPSGPPPLKGEAGTAANGPATETQKKWIIDNATDGDYMSIMQKYGANLERLSMKVAVRVIEQIRTNNAKGAAS